MFRRLSLAVAAVTMLGAGSANALGIDATGVPGQWLLTPAVGASMTFNCSPCEVSALADLPAGYATNRYDGDDPIALQRTKFFGSEHIVMESGAGGTLTAAGATTGETKGIMVKDDGSTFFFNYAGAGSTGNIVFSFVGKVASNVTFTPIPAALGLLLTGLAGLYGIKRFRRDGLGVEAVPA